MVKIVLFSKQYSERFLVIDDDINTKVGINKEVNILQNMAVT